MLLFHGNQIDRKYTLAYESYGRSVGWWVGKLNLVPPASLLLCVNCLGGVVCVLRTWGPLFYSWCGWSRIMWLSCGCFAGLLRRGDTDSMHCADGAAAERRQLLFGCGVMIALLYVALLLCWWLLMVHDDDDDDDDDDTAVGDGWSIDDYDAVLFICVGLLLCVRWGHCSREWSAAIDIFCQLV